jgi:hypothetical protein
MSKFHWISLLSISLIFSACLSGEPKEEAPSTTATQEVDLSDFYAFYRKFHNDSLFQVNHIAFPLKGVPSSADSAALANDNFTWKRENWRMHKPIDFEVSEFQRDLKPVGESMVIESIVNPEKKVGMVRHYAKVAGEWNLIYYVGINKLK